MERRDEHGRLDDYTRLAAQNQRLRLKWQELESENATLRKELARKHCGCAWCCAATPPSRRGEAHKRTCQPQALSHPGEEK